MDEPNPLFHFLIDMATRLPLMIVWVVGIVMAAVRWRRHPTPSLMMLIGLIVLIVGSIAVSLAHHLWVFSLIRDGAEQQSMQVAMATLQLTGLAFHLTGWILVLVAAFKMGSASALAVDDSRVLQGAGGLGDDQRQALSQITPLSRSFYAVTIAVVFGLGSVMTIVSTAFTLLADEPVIGGGIACANMLLLIAGSVTLCVFIYRIWAAIQAGEPRTTPGKALGFLFIPFFGFYWVFQVYWGWTKDYNRFIAEQRIDAPRMPEGLALALCIFMIVATPVGFIPFVGPIVGIAGLVMMVLFVAKACDGVQALVNAAGSVTHTPSPQAQDERS